MNTDNVRRHFEDEAKEFDRVILTLIPHYTTIVRVLVEAIPFERSAPLRVIDLGCGTGTVAAKVLEIFPNAHVTCLDLAENMIAIAKAKLASYPQVQYIVTNFQEFDFGRKYDAVVSSLALHHLPTDADKQKLYRRIYENLNTGGVFYNADVILAPNAFLHEMYINAWLKFMERSISRKEIEGKWLPKHQQEDHPAKLLDQLSWLANIGFADVEVLWKYYDFAVYGGMRR
jgi:tRNA (cmo5U34)-methyltransferase